MSLPHSLDAPANHVHVQPNATGRLQEGLTFQQSCLVPQCTPVSSCHSAHPSRHATATYQVKSHRSAEQYCACLSCSNSQAGTASEGGVEVCREMDSGSSTPSSMAPSAGASPRRWSSFGTKGRISEEGGTMLRRASEAAGLAEAGPQSHGLAQDSGSTTPDPGLDLEPFHQQDADHCLIDNSLAAHKLTMKVHSMQSHADACRINVSMIVSMAQTLGNQPLAMTFNVVSETLYTYALPLGPRQQGLSKQQPM